MKKITSVIIAAIITMLTCLLPTAPALAKKENQYPIEFEGKKIAEQAFVSEGSLYLPLRAVCNSLGYYTVWNAQDKKLTFIKKEKMVELDMNTSKIKINDHEFFANHVPLIKNGKAFMKETFFEECLGADIRPGKTVSIMPVEENPISIKTIKETSSGDYIDITLQYPQIEGLQDKTVQDSLNAVFRKAAENAKNEGLANGEAMRSYFESGYTGSPNKCETYFDYAVKYNQKGLLSIVFLDYQYSGGAHGLTVQTSTTFNLSTGQEYKLKDIFAKGADYVSLLSQEVKKTMQEQGMADYLLSPFEAISADQGFYLTNSALVVYFQAYEYTPYAYGIPEFAIEYSLLQDILSQEFKMLK